MNVLIIGAGPAAAGAAIALAKVADTRVTVLDVGGRLEVDNELARLRMSDVDPGHWDRSDVHVVSRTAVATASSGLPEKRTYGSDFPFRNFGQLDGVTSTWHTVPHVVSGAYGGFSNTWGAQTMTYSAAAFDDWPFSRSDLETDYRAILAAIPYSGEVDDLAEYFPLWGDADPLPPLSERSVRVLRAYERNRAKVRRQGVLVGKARLALAGNKCVSCGLCMTGCPYSFVYSASQTFDELQRQGKITYVGRHVATRVGETEGRPFVAARSLDTGRLESFTADKVLIACGALGTTRLVSQSLQSWSRRIHMSESVQFLMPFVSPRATATLTQEGSFTLNQFNMILPFDEEGHDLVQIHCYPYNDAMDEALPRPLQLRALRGVRTQLLKRITIGLGYLPSWASPGFDVSFTPPARDDELAGMSLDSTRPVPTTTAPMMRQVRRRLWRSARHLGMVPVVPLVTLASPTKSYHFGGSYPLSSDPQRGLESDTLGRVHPWENIHLIDASVFPTVPATTFTLSIMANAHRIARSAIGETGSPPDPAR